jgi:hypothetical protein
MKSIGKISTASCVLRIAAVLIAICTQAPAQNYPGHWTGKWIWSPGEARPKNFFLMARREFTVPNSLPDAATLSITASNRYILYVNGKYIGRGPARSDQFWKSYDAYDLVHQLRPGKNAVAVLAYYYGGDNNYGRDERAGLFAELQLRSSGQEQIACATDRTWRVRQARAWRQNGVRAGVQEVYDANAEIPGWTAADFDDSGWQTAEEIKPMDTPWGYLERRQTPMMRETEISPARIVERGEVLEIAWRLGETAAAQRLALEPHLPLRYTTIDNAEDVMKPDGHTARLRSSPYRFGEELEKGIRSPYLILDFGRPVFGFPKVQLSGPAGGVLEMSYAVDLINGRPMTLLGGVPYGDRYVMKPGEQTWQVFEYKPFRYLQIVFRNVHNSVSVDAIAAVAYEYPAERKGKFQSSDGQLTALWKSCVDTTYLHMEDTLVCDAMRERLPWTGDGAHGLYGIYAGFGDIALTDWFYRLLSRSKLPDGMLRIYYPGTEPPVGGVPLGPAAAAYENPQNIPQFALFYVMFVAEHYQYFGKRDLLQELYPTLVGVADWFYRHRDETDLLYSLSNLNFVDWVPTEMRGANLETNAMYYKMLVDLATLANESGHKDDAQKWKERADAVRASIRKLHWNPARGLYADSVLQGKQSSIVTELSNSFTILFDLATEEQKQTILKHLTNPPADLLRATPLYYHYVSEALMKAGVVDFALKDMKSRYALTLQASDVPTIREFWSPYVRPFSSDGEIYDPTGGYTGQPASPVHAGGVGPAWTLSKHVLGVSPVGAGFQRCQVRPRTDALEWARGVFPSVRGDIGVEWRRDAGNLVLEVTLPPNLETDIVLTRPKKVPAVITHNGARYSVDSAEQRSAGLRVDQESVVVTVKGGRHQVVVPDI